MSIWERVTHNLTSYGAIVLFTTANTALYSNRFLPLSLLVEFLLCFQFCSLLYLYISNKMLHCHAISIIDIVFFFLCYRAGNGVIEYLLIGKMFFSGVEFNSSFRLPILRCCHLYCFSFMSLIDHSSWIMICPPLPPPPSPLSLFFVIKHIPTIIVYMCLKHYLIHSPVKLFTCVNFTPELTRSI